MRATATAEAIGRSAVPGKDRRCLRAAWAVARLVTLVRGLPYKAIDDEKLATIERALAVHPKRCMACAWTMSTEGREIRQ
jgi:hypothetical protein